MHTLTLVPILWQLGIAVVLLIIIGVVMYVVRITQYIDETSKPLIMWLLRIAGAIVVVLFLLWLIGVGNGVQVA